MTDNDQAGRNSHDHSKCGHDHDATSLPGKPGETAVDPVCGMTVDPRRRQADNRDGAERNITFAARVVMIASLPIRIFTYRGTTRKSARRRAKNALYTCPMDPEIVQEGPGTCPVCGMALEPMDGVSDEPNHELVDFTRRLWVSVVAAVPLIILTMGPMVGLPVRDWIGEHLAVLLEFALATPVVVWAARPFFHRGWTSIRTWNLNMWTLIMIGVGAAYLYSVTATFFPAVVSGRAADGRRAHAGLLRSFRGDHRAGVRGAGS